MGGGAEDAASCTVVQNCSPSFLLRVPTCCPGGARPTPRPQAWPAECSVTVLEHRYLVHIPSKTIVSSLLFPMPRQEPGDACRGGPVGCIPEQKRSSKATSGPLWAYDTSEHQS